MGRPGLSLDKKFRRLAHDLDDFQAGFGRVLARGALELLWDTAYEACTDEVGDAFDVEAAAEWRGPSGRLVKALVEAGGGDNAGFIEEGGSAHWPDGKSGTYRIHDLWDHAPEYARKRVEREEEREAKGKTIKEMRAEAGRKGAAKTNAKRPANVRPPSGNSPTNGATRADQEAATVATLAGTPSPHPAQPAPAPAPSQPPATADRQADEWLAGFRQKLASRLGLNAVDIGKDRKAVLAFFHAQLEAVGEDQLLAECCDLAPKSTTGTPSSLAWFVNFLRRLPSPEATQ